MKAKTVSDHAAALNEARLKSLSAEEKSAIGKKAAEARWNDRLPKATHDGALKIGDIELPCYVLDDGRRVIVQRGLQVGMGMSSGGGKEGLHRIGTFLRPIEAKGIDIKDLIARTQSPIRFRPAGLPLAYGYEATILADLCEVVLDARGKGALHQNSEHIAGRCELLMRGFARVGIIALVDEATGFQKDRARDALAKILEEFITKELRPWVRTFPPEFYEEMFRLRGWPYDPTSVKRPGVVAKYTTDIAYQRLAPGVLEELKRITPRDDNGRLKHKLHQRLTEEVGVQKLKDHLIGSTVLMKASDSWAEFMRKLDRVYPRYGDNLLLPFKDEE